MNKCPKCGYIKKSKAVSKESFNEMMNRVIRESGNRLKDEMGFGIPSKGKIKNKEPRKFKGELDHVKRNN